jgi:hypothetical protein
MIDLNEYEFSQFVAWDGTHYSVDVPFDHIIVESGEKMAIANATNVSFALKAIADI